MSQTQSRSSPGLSKLSPLLFLVIFVTKTTHAAPHADDHDHAPTKPPVNLVTMGHPHWPPYHPRPPTTTLAPNPPVTTPEDPQHGDGVFQQVCTELNVTGYWKRSPFVGNILQVRKFLKKGYCF